MKKWRRKENENENEINEMRFRQTHFLFVIFRSRTNDKTTSHYCTQPLINMWWLGVCVWKRAYPRTKANQKKHFLSPKKKKKKFACPCRLWLSLVTFHRVA